MTQSTTKPATVESPLSALRRKWWLALILCPLGAALGATLASIGPTKYTVESRLSVGDGELSSQAVPGFALARQQLAEDYSRWVNNTAADSAGEGVEIVSSPIPESAIIRIEGTSSSQADATKGVNDAADALKKRVNAAKPGNDPAAVLKQFETAALASAKMESQVDEAFANYQSAIGAKRSASAIRTLKTRLDDLRGQAALLNVRRDSLSDKYKTLVANQTTSVDLVTVREARVTNNDRVAKLQRYGLLGFVLGGLVSLLLATWSARNNPRPANRRPAGAAPVRRQPAARKQAPAKAAPAKAVPAAGATANGNSAPWAQTRAAAPAASTQAQPSTQAGTRTQAADGRRPAAPQDRGQDGKPRS